MRLFESKGGNLQAKVNDLKPKAELTCPDQKQIVAIEFASFGDPFGACGSFFVGNCTSPISKEVAEKVNLVFYMFIYNTNYCYKFKYFLHYKILMLLNCSFVFEQFCLGKTNCKIPLDTVHFGNQNDACEGMKKSLAVQAKCAQKP